MRIKVIGPRPSVETHLLYSINKGLSGFLGQVIGQLGLVLVRDNCFNPRAGLTQNEASGSRHGDVDRGG